MKRLTDPQLLRDYTERRSEAAFTELVRRHVDLVYSAALRMVCDAHLAKDVTRRAVIAFFRSTVSLLFLNDVVTFLARHAAAISAQSSLK